MQETRENTDYLPGIKLPESVRVTSELRDCAGADLIVFVTPSAALREIATRLRKLISNSDAVLLSCTKGIDHVTGKRTSQIFREILPEHLLAVLPGPNLAVETAQNLTTATGIGSNDPDHATQLQHQ